MEKDSCPEDRITHALSQLKSDLVSSVLDKFTFVLTLARCHVPMFIFSLSVSKILLNRIILNTIYDFLGGYPKSGC